MPVLGIRLVSAEIDDTLRRHRLLALLGAAFGALSLGLAGIGVYAMFNALVTTRRREIGIRMAIGAELGDNWRLLALEALIITIWEPERDLFAPRCPLAWSAASCWVSGRLMPVRLFSRWCFWRAYRDSRMAPGAKGNQG